MGAARANLITLLLFVGGGGKSAVEITMRRAVQAAARDLLERLLACEEIGQAIIATDDAEWASSLREWPVTVDLDPPGIPFHFGQRLADLIARHDVKRALYAGGGAAPLLTTTQWREMLHRWAAGGPGLLTNNLHSSDWIGFQPADGWLSLIAAQARDNGLAWALSREAGLPACALPPTAASRFDLDTPADLLVARLHPAVGPHLQAALSELDWPGEPVEQVLQVMATEGAHLALIGRTSAAAWAALEQQTQCWVRCFAEERGMIASGRLSRGEVRSLLNVLLDRVGIREFFRTLASMCQALLLDSRVILGARGLWPSAADRFNADLGRWREVGEPFLRDFSRAATETEIPILMGGQSVVSGGLLALLEVLAARRASAGGLSTSAPVL